MSWKLGFVVDSAFVKRLASYRGCHFPIRCQSMLATTCNRRHPPTSFPCPYWCHGNRRTRWESHCSMGKLNRYSSPRSKQIEFFLSNFKIWNKYFDFDNNWAKRKKKRENKEKRLDVALFKIVALNDKIFEHMVRPLNKCFRSHCADNVSEWR